MRKLKTEIWPHQVKISHDFGKNDNEARAWCETKLGYRFKDWYCYDTGEFPACMLFAFKDAETALMFKLKFGYKRTTHEHN